MFFRSIRSRIAVTYVLLIALSMAGLTWYVLAFVRSSYVGQLEHQMASEASLIAEVVRPTFLTGSSERADDLADRYAAILGARVSFIDDQGVVLGDSEAEPDVMLNHLQRPEIAQARETGLGVAQRYSNTVSYDALYVAVPVLTGDSEQGYVRLAVPLRAIDETVAMLRGRILGTTAVVLAIALLLGILIAEKTARPVRELTSVVRRVAQGDLSVRLVQRSRDEVGLLTQDFGVMTDQLRSTITDLERERSEVSAILEHMADGIVITDAQGTIQLINRSAERMLGVTAEQAQGRSLAQVARDETIIMALRACLRERQEQCELVEIPRRNLFLQVIATPITSQAQQARCLMVLQDLGEVRRVEAMRRDLVGNISHELRTPIASLRALTDTLSGGALDDPPAAERFLARMDVEIDDLSQIVEELLQLSRIESGEAPLRLAPIGALQVIEPAIERLRPQIERAGLTSVVSAPEGLPAMLADREQLQLVLTNLLHNAIKFTPQGGSISVSAEARPGALSISVADTGVGIPAASLPRVFERFYKVDRSRASSGTGLGLAIAQHIVQAHGGEINVASVEGQGATFTFTIPTAGATA